MSGRLEGYQGIERTAITLEVISALMAVTGISLAADQYFSDGQYLSPGWLDAIGWEKNGLPLLGLGMWGVGGVFITDFVRRASRDLKKETS